MPRVKIISDKAVLKAALTVMFRRGPSDFTLADVAQVAGIAPATLVQRFGGKHGLIVAAFAEDNRRFADALAGAPQAVGAEAVIDLFWTITPSEADEDALADQLLWLRQDMGDLRLNALARERFAILREAVAARLPALSMDGATAARLVEAQWQGALTQWAVERRGRLADYVAESLAAWFDLAAASLALTASAAKA